MREFTQHGRGSREALRAFARDPREGTARIRRLLTPTKRLGDCRRDLAEAHRFVDDAASGRLVGSQDQQRNVHLPAIQAEAVSEEAMFLEMFAVVGRQDDKCVVEQPTVFEFVNEQADLLKCFGR
jgi:hypothetical protein